MHNHYSHIICKEVSNHLSVSLASHCSVVHQKITPKGPIQDNRCPMPHKCILPYMKIAFTLHTISSEEKLLFSPETGIWSILVCLPPPSCLVQVYIVFYPKSNKLHMNQPGPGPPPTTTTTTGTTWYTHMFLNTSTKHTITARLYEIPYVPLLLMTCRNIIC